jgi:hypothetical protein
MDVTSLVYFHTDHFEPWRPVGKVPAVGPEIVDAIGDFCRLTERMDFARRLTLFYKPHLNYALRVGDDLVRADPRDLVGFLQRSEHEERFGREAMREIGASSAHDVQLHIHHEYYTATTAHTEPEAVAWFGGPLGRALDGQRLELAIRLNRAIMAREMGRSTARWFFIHGHWALNGSDESSCTINNEIEILLRNECRGDFTFPAGRQHTNPRIKVPYLCRPFEAPKGYDRPEAEPEIASGNTLVAADKFFIWASPASSQQCSLDYLSPSSRRHIENTEKAARELIDNAYIADRRMFIKTHAHSMHSYYFEHARSAVFPHQYPPTQTLLSVIFEAATDAKIDVQFLTAPEVYDLLLAAESKPQMDLVSSYLKPAGLFRSSARPTPYRVSAAFAPAHALEMVRETAAPILRQRIEDLGVRGSGAYGHYSQMLDRGFPIPPHELMALDVVRREVPRLSAYQEIGSGIGTLPFLLALNGYPSVGIECDRRRHETALAIWRVLAPKARACEPICDLVFGRFPTAVMKRDRSDTLAILTDFVTTQTVQQVQEIIEGLHGYPYVLIDLSRFCVLRTGAEAQLKLLRDFSTQGFKQCGEIVPAADCAFALLRNETVKPRRSFSLPSWFKPPWAPRTGARARG